MMSVLTRGAVYKLQALAADLRPSCESSPLVAISCILSSGPSDNFSTASADGTLPEMRTRIDRIVGTFKDARRS